MSGVREAACPLERPTAGLEVVQMSGVPRRGGEAAGPLERATAGPEVVPI